MSKSKLFATAAMLAAVPLAFGQAFTAGNIVVAQLGDGTNPLLNTGNVISLIQFAPDGTVLGGVDLPNSGPTSIISSGTATSEGQLVRSADGRYLLYYGYGAELPNSVVLNSSSGSVIPRTVARIDANGTVDTSTRLTDAQSGNNPRSATSPDGVRLYVAGANGGIRVTTVGSTTAPTQVNDGNTNLRVVKAINGNLYYSTGSNTPQVRGIYKVAGYPLLAGAMTTQVVSTDHGVGNSSPYDFIFANNNTTLYVADDRTNGSGGIQRYNLSVNGDFVFDYVISVGASAGARALEEVDGVLFAITTNGRLVSLTDTGPTSVVTDLATAGANFAFRGLAKAPVAPQVTFLNTSTSDLAAWRYDGGEVISSNVFGNLPSGWSPVAVGDYNGNGSDDWLFFNSSSNLMAIWFMEDLTVAGTAVFGITPGFSPTSATGDFNGDGVTDIVFVNASGDYAIWLMNGSEVFETALFPGLSGWEVAGIGDLNGDGNSDIIWRNASLQLVAVWLMDGTDVDETGAFGIDNVWAIAAVRDFDGDGNDDVFFMDQGGSRAAIWLMDGVDVTAQQAYLGLGSFIPVGFGDFNADGKTDIIWNSGTTYAFWLMDGTSVVETAAYVVDGYALVGVNDFNRDGRDDLFWTSPSGDNTVWQMNGVVPTPTILNSTGPNWLPVGLLNS
ncbi:MAG: FG-GAP-like repeat-containing protein [Fimbriimonadaceae bacterium]